MADLSTFNNFFTKIPPKIRSRNKKPITMEGMNNFYNPRSCNAKHLFSVIVLHVRIPLWGMALAILQSNSFNDSFPEDTSRCQKYIYCVRPPCHMQRHWEILLVKRTEYRQCQLGNCVLIFANWYAFKRNCWLLWMALWFEVSVNSLRLKDKLVGFEKSVFVSGWKEILFHSPKLPRTFCHRLMICLQVWQLIRKDLEKRKCLKYWRNIPEKM